MYTIRSPGRSRQPLAWLLAAGLAGPAASLAAQTRSVSDTTDLGAFVDGLIRLQMEQHRIPSAAVVVVQGDRVLYQAGYGFANRAKRTPIDPATSMFHIGSTGKLFTWTAVMQLVEQGKLNLDADINTYLTTFQIPAAFGRPITLRHLMTHTAGFQEGILGYFIGNDTLNIKSIEQTLRLHVPARVRPPGILASYSNYGASLAGLIVEQVSGEPFAEYIEHHIYAPLGIRHATFREPLPPALRPDAVTGYAWIDGAFQAMPFEIDGGFVPSGGTVMAPLDMARFMTAHLQEGRFGDTKILQPATARLMQTQAFAHDPRLPGLGLGFIEERYRGHRIVGHSGDSQYFHVDMVLIPDQQLGLFVAYGGEESTMARELFKAAFFERYLAPIDSAGPVATPAPANLDRYLGRYRPVRMNYTDIDKLVYLVALAPISVTALDSNRVLVSGGLSPDWQPTQFTPAGSDLLREVGGERLIAFRSDSASGEVTHLFFEPAVALERIPWQESPAFWYPVLALAAVILASALIDGLYRRGAIPAAERRTARLVWLTAAWPFLTIAAAAVVIGIYQMSILERIPAALQLVLGLPIIFVGLTGLVAAQAVTAWRRRTGPTGPRIHLTLVALAALSLCWFCWQWNLLGWQFG